MKRTERIRRPIIPNHLEEKVEFFLDDLLTVGVADAVDIILEALVRWSEHLSLENIEQFVGSHQPRAEEIRYNDFAAGHKRRLFLILYYDELLMWADSDPSVLRAALVGWREIAKGEKETLIEQITAWLDSLWLEDAFNAILELALRWAERYNTKMGLSYAQFCGRSGAEDWDDENLTFFLRWCFHNNLELADSMHLHRSGPWPE
jgi:hypothetical protein